MRVTGSDDSMSQSSRDQMRRESLASYTLGELSPRVTTNRLSASSNGCAPDTLVWLAVLDQKEIWVGCYH